VPRVGFDVPRLVHATNVGDSSGRGKWSAARCD
jgi:hypothetical protein